MARVDWLKLLVLLPSTNNKPASLSGTNGRSVARKAKRAACAKGWLPFFLPAAFPRLARPLRAPPASESSNATRRCVRAGLLPVPRASRDSIRGLQRSQSAADLLGGSRPLAR